MSKLAELKPRPYDGEAPSIEPLVYCEHEHEGIKPCCEVHLSIGGCVARLTNAMDSTPEKIVMIALRYGLQNYPAAIKDFIQTKFGSELASSEAEVGKAR